MRERGLTLIEVVVVVVIIFILAVLLLPAVAQPRGRGGKKRDCVNNLKQLGTSMLLYVDRFGSGKSYPRGSGSAFWDALRNVPTPATSILLDNDGLFVCKMKGTNPSQTAMDYTGPRASWFPPADELKAASRLIAADLPTNHDPGGKGDINVLFFDGHVETAQYGTALWDQAARDTEP